MRRIHSISKGNDFRRVYRQGKSIADENLVVYIRKSTLPISRIGFSISKKVGKAVVRNKIKRRLREIFRHNLSLLKENVDIVVIVRSAAVEADYAQLNRSYLKSLRQLKALKEIKEE